MQQYDLASGDLHAEVCTMLNDTPHMANTYEETLLGYLDWSETLQDLGGRWSLSPLTQGVWDSWNQEDEPVQEDEPAQAASPVQEIQTPIPLWIPEHYRDDALKHYEDERVSGQEVPISAEVTEDFGGALALNYFTKASAVSKKSAETKNITSHWVQAHYNSIFPMLTKHLSSKLKLSRQMTLIEDHIHTFLLRLIARDTLAPYLRDGRKIHLKAWAYQSACTEMRGWGVDANLRTSRGAKTNRDQLVERGKLPAVVIHTGDSVVERRYEIENGEYVGDLYNPHARNVEAELISAETLQNAKSIVQRKLARTNPHCEVLLDALIDGEKQVDIAEAHGLSRSQTGVMISQIREVLRKGLPMIQA